MILALCAALTCLGSSPGIAVRVEDPAPAPKTARVLVPGTRIRLEPPAGHEPGRGFLGYQWSESAASLIVVEMPGAYAEVARGFDAKAIEKGGMKLVSATDAKISGRDARLVHTTQESQGIRFEKWIAIYGDDKRSVLLNAVYPEELAGTFSAPMKAALLGSEWDPDLEVDPFAPLPWTIAKPEGLRFAGNMGTTLAYTEDGEFVQKGKGGAARILVSPSMGEVQVGDARAFAEKRLAQLPLGKNAAIESSTAFEAGGRTGWEIVAKARDEKEAVDLLVHQVLLVGEGEYHLFVSQCGLDRRETWLPRFRACASSWKLKEAPQDAPK